MAGKRKYAALCGEGPSEARIDPHYGQHHAFPGLDDVELDDPDSDDPEADSLDQSHVDYLLALGYLRDVRAEAQSIPTVLKAQQDPGTQTPSTFDNAVNLVKSYYADGAYFSVPDEGSKLEDSTSSHDKHDNAEADPSSSQTSTLEAEDAYHRALLSRFQATKSSYASLGSPSPQALSSLDPKTHPVYVDHQQPAKIESAKWSYVLQNEKPTPAQILAMPQESILWLLDRIPSMMKRKKWLVDGGRQGQAMGLWIWSLLLRLNEPGTLNYEEIGTVRGLGKRAAGITNGLDSNHEQDWDAGEEEDEPNEDTSPIDQGIDLKDNQTAESPGESESEVEVTGLLTAADMEAVKQRILSSIGSKPDADEKVTQKSSEKISDPINVGNSLQNEEICIATLDMILTITGEYYGQRDLLEARDRLWIRD